MRPRIAILREVVYPSVGIFVGNQFCNQFSSSGPLGDNDLWYHHREPAERKLQHWEGLGSGWVSLGASWEGLRASWEGLRAS